MSCAWGLVGCVWLAIASEDPSAAPIVPEARAAATIEAPRVLVIGAPADDAAVRRVAAELEAIGFAVQIEITTEPRQLASPELDEPTAAWRAIVRVDTASGEAHLYVRDRTGRTTARIVERGPDEQPASDVVLAHRTVEVLRASLRQMSSVDPPVVAPAPIVPSEVPKPAAPRPSVQRYDELFVLIGGAITGSPGRLAPIGHAAVGLRWQVHPRIGIAVRGLAPLHARQVRRAEGSASAWLGTAESWLFVGLARPSRRWQPDLGVSVGAVLLGVRGEATVPLQSRTDLVAAATVAGGAGLSVWLHARVRLRVDAFVGAAVPRPAVRFAGREVASWGRPFAGGTLGVEIGVL